MDDVKQANGRNSQEVRSQLGIVCLPALGDVPTPVGGRCGGKTSCHVLASRLPESAKQFERGVNISAVEAVVTTAPGSGLRSRPSSQNHRTGSTALPIHRPIAPIPWLAPRHI